MKRHAKASTAGSDQRQAKGLGRFFRGALATRGASPDAKGSDAPAARFLAAVLASLVLLVLFAAPTFAAESPDYLFSFGPDGTETSNFGTIGAVAVDESTGATYVIDQENGSLLRFDSDGQPVPFGGSALYIVGNEITGLNLRNLLAETDVAVDPSTHVIYVVDDDGETLRAFEASGEPSVFTAGPGAHTNEISFGNAQGIAVDSLGNIYVSDFANGIVKIFAATGEPITEFAVATPADLAVNTAGVVYVVGRSQEQVAFFTPSESPVTPATTYTAGLQPLHPNKSFSVAVDPATNEVYVGQDPINPSFDPALIAVYDSSGAAVDTLAGPGEPNQVGLPVGLAFYDGEDRLFASDNSGARVKVFGPEIIVVDRPTIESSSVSDVASDSATLSSRINPNRLDTTYRFEYGPGDCSLSACASVPVGGAKIEAGHKGVAVSQDVAGLQAGTTYHFRVLAQNSKGVREGPDRTFTTQLSGLGFGLADDRAWEMVSPPNKFGARLAGSSVGLIQAAADGDGLAYLSIGSTEADPEGNRIIEPSSILGRRGPEGWRSEDISPPHTKVVPYAQGNLSEYKLFNQELSGAALQQRDAALLSPQASERTPYLRENTERAIYTPLVTGKEGFANVPSGTEFGGDLIHPSGAVSIVGATPDLGHVVLKSNVPLAAGVPAPSLYEWTVGQLKPLSALPAGEGGGFVAAPFIGSQTPEGPGSMRHAISDDGSRVFWTAQETGRLYLRDTAADETLRLDVVQPGASGSGVVKPIFQGASADGSVVFFTDTQQLTEGASPSGADLYRCEIPLRSAPLECAALTNISAPAEGSGDSAEMRGVVSALSDDATMLYFVANGVLDSNSNQEGDSAVGGEPNLYLWQKGEGTRFIATLSEKDTRDWGPEQEYSLSTDGSPSGRYLSFMSQRSLVGYDNRDAVTGESVEEVFHYDAVFDRLDCVSCNPSGASPKGQQRLEFGPLVDPQGLWADRGLAADLPEATIASISGGVFYRPRSVLDNGRVLFNAFDALVPADSNGQWDVYQYEPIGVGDCTTSSGGAAISRSGGGCVSLISSGTAEEEAAFLDASTTGDDVFFLTSAKLSVTDEDSELDVYDARVDGVPATLTPNTECLGEACQPAAIAPNDPTPSSSSFKGQGNVVQSPRKRCAKGKRAVRRGGKARCVARKPHAKQKRHDRAGKSRRAGR